MEPTGYPGSTNSERESGDAVAGIPQWFLLMVCPKWERRVADALQAKGYEVFLPMHTVRRQWSDRLKEYAAPLFPSYVFCRFPLGPMKKGMSVFAITGVLHVFPGTGKGQPIPEFEIERLRRITSSQYPVECLDLPHTGEIVEILGETAIQGVLIERAAVCRVAIGFDAMKRTVVLRVPLADLKHTGASLKPHWSLNRLDKF